MAGDNSAGLHSQLITENLLVIQRALLAPGSNAHHWERRWGGEGGGLGQARICVDST